MRMNNIKSNLQIYLMTTGKTLKDLKVEVILIFCLNLIREYTHCEDNKIDYGYSRYMTDEERSFIYKKLKELEDYLFQTVYTVEEMYRIINNRTTKDGFIKAMIMQPRLYFYDFFVTRFISKMNIISDNGKKYYIPELLALYLFVDMKEKNYSFKEFTFIEEFDFLGLIEIYNRINLHIRKINNIKINVPLMQRTTISQMQYLSLYLCNVLTEAKYINKKYKK